MDPNEFPRRRPSGRRSGDSGTREAILDAARDLFAERGYEGASMRAIAQEAGVDPALVRHFFTNKELLFATTMADRSVIPDRIAAAFPGPAETVGERVTDTYMRLWEDEETRPLLIGVVRSAMTSEHGIQLLSEMIGGRIGEAANLPGVIPTSSMALAASQLLGVAIGRYVVGLPALVELTHEELVAQLAPMVQHMLPKPLTDDESP